MKVPEENMGEYIYNCEMKRSSKIWHKAQTSWRKILLNLTNKWKTTLIAKAPIKVKNAKRKWKRIFVMTKE